jgi:hypothetical protein
MLPDFTANGLLPPGIHIATVEEFKTRLVFFARSDRRYRIFDKLLELYHEARRSGIVKRFLVGGSFITAQAEPNDFDCILVMDPTIVGRDLLPMEYNLMSQRMTRRRFGGDVFSLREGTQVLDEYLEFFQRTRSEERVGIVEIAL